MFRIDKQLDLSRLIGTSRPSFASVQLFTPASWASIATTRSCNWPTGNARAARTRPADRHPGDELQQRPDQPDAGGGLGRHHGGGFVIPSVEFVIGDNWRLKGELDLFFNQGNEKTRYLNPNTGALEEKGRPRLCSATSGA